MTKGLYAIHDLVANIYHAPLCFSSDVDARRHFHMAIKNQPTVREFKNELTIDRIGMFDDLTGKVSDCTPEVIVSGSQIQIQKDGE